MEITTGSGNDTVTRPVLVDGVIFRSNDIIKTGAGNDTINAGLGKDDYVDGGEGTDRLIVNFSVGDTGGGMYFNSGVNLNLGTADRHDGGTNPSRLDYIAFKNIENFTVTGTSKDDTIKTYFGNSIIKAGAGNDIVIAVAGTLDGGSGFDDLTLDLSTQTNNLNLSNLSNINVPGVVTAINFEQFSITTGSGNDTVTQTGIVNGAVLRANDIIKTGAGNDTINAGLGKNDYVYGGDGIDSLIVDFSTGDTGTGMDFYAGDKDGRAYRTVSSTDSTRLDRIFTNKDDSITIVATGNDIINAGAGNDTIRGGAGGDILTGGAGIDTFEYKYLTDSLLANYDVIKDLAIGSDVIDGARAVAASQIKKLGNVTALTETAIKEVLTSANFSINGASTFKFSDRTFLGLNDGTAGFSASADAIIEITGFTGSLANLKIV
jgi:Ca2+-binding RTX toxin-like protein